MAQILLSEAFCASLLNSLPMGFYSPSQLIRMRKDGIVVLPVCVNHSAIEHQVVPHQQSFCYSARSASGKGLSDSGSEQLLRARPTGGFQHVNRKMQN